MAVLLPSLRIAHCSLLIAHWADCWLLIADCWLLIAHCSFSIMHSRLSLDQERRSMHHNGLLQLRNDGAYTSELSSLTSKGTAQASLMAVLLPSLLSARALRASAAAAVTPSKGIASSSFTRTGIAYCSLHMGTIRAASAWFLTHA